ncbi:MAG: glycosyltransferase, partial [Lentisphaerota bacterium]
PLDRPCGFSHKAWLENAISGGSRVSNKIALSIVIPSYNSSRVIAHCLDSLAPALERPDVEVIVVDSSDDGTDALIRGRFPRVQLHHVPQRVFPGPARNIGARLAKSDVLAFIDADCVAAPDWATAVLQVFREHPEESACVGCVANHNPGSLVGWVSFITEFNGYFGRQQRRAVTALPTFSTTFKRDVFMKYGGFPEDVAWLEDMIFCAKLLQGGERLFLEPAILVHHHNRSEWGRFIHHQYRLGQFFAHSRFDADLPGASALRKSGFSIPLLAAWRGWKAYQRSFQGSAAVGMLLVLFAPLYGLGVIYWMFGVAKGRRECAGKT